MSSFSPLLLFSGQVVAIISVLLLAIGNLKADPKSSSSRVFAIIAIFVVFYLLNGMTAAHIDPQFRLNLSGVQIFIDSGINAISGLFMMYCFLVFQEGEKFPVMLGITFILQVLIDIAINVVQPGGSMAGSSDLLSILSISVDVLKVIFVGYAIYWTLKGWTGDLVADRRVLRWFIISVQGSLIFAVVFLESFVLDGGSERNATGQAMIVFSTALLTLGMLLVAMRFDFVSLSHAIRQVTEQSKNIEDDSIIDDVKSFDGIFKDGLFYREAGLTISMLAKKLNLPEYRLRSFIHKQLGYRNFNAMLHQYRIEDAGQMLSELENSAVPVLTVALSVGYQSITPFNNAFKKIKGVTPSEYRKNSR